MYGNTGLNPSLDSDYCVEARRVFRAMEFQPDARRRKLINYVIRGLKINGDWNKLIGYFQMAAHHPQAALIDWKNPERKLTLVGSPFFETDRGITTDLGKYIDTGFNPATTQGYSVEDALIMLYVNTNVAEDNSDIDTRIDTNSRILMQTRSTTNDVLMAMHTPASAGVTNDNSIGCYILRRRPSQPAILLKNNAILASRGEVNSIPNKNLLIGKRAENTNYTTKRYPSFSIGSGFIDNVFLNNITTEYLTEIGAN